MFESRSGTRVRRGSFRVRREEKEKSNASKSRFGGDRRRGRPRRRVRHALTGKRHADGDDPAGRPAAHHGAQRLRPRLAPQQMGAVCGELPVSSLCLLWLVWTALLLRMVPPAALLVLAPPSSSSPPSPLAAPLLPEPVSVARGTSRE